MQLRSARPSTWTVQAPQIPAPQPDLVPGRPARSRMAQSSGISAGASKLASAPFSVRFLAP